MSGTAGAGTGLRSSLGRAQRWLSRTLLEPEYPLVAVEIRPRAVAAVRLAREGSGVALGAAAVVPLPEGTLDVALTRTNVTDPEGFQEVLRTALERAGALSGGPVSLVLPDPVVRLTMVSAEGLKGRGAEAQETVRFRLHKALPFDVRAARVAWSPARGEQILVAVALDEVVAGYEEALEELGFSPGLVEASTLALASLWNGDGAGGGDRLLLNWDDDYVSFLLLRGDAPLLVRTLPGEVDAESVARQASSTMQFYRDRLSGSAFDDVAVRVAVGSPDEACRALEPVLGRPPRVLEPWELLGGGPTSQPSQAVAGAAACALRRVG